MISYNLKQSIALISEVFALRQDQLYFSYEYTLMYGVWMYSSILSTLWIICCYKNLKMVHYTNFVELSLKTK